MNPLHWKREHQAALICAAALGFLIGMMFGLFYLNPPPRYPLVEAAAPSLVGGFYLPLGYLLLLLFGLPWEA
jgi:hypothetical protein